MPEDDTPVRWPVRVWDGLFATIIVAPLMYTNTRAKVDPRLHMTDASLWRAGCAVAELPSELAEYLWRYADIRGHHTWLEPQATLLAGGACRQLSAFEAQFTELVEGLTHK
eukprot:9997450-Heterocapsa_arctica.AAC.1